MPPENKNVIVEWGPAPERTRLTLEGGIIESGLDPRAGRKMERSAAIP
jgi:hypothetical protein